MSKLKYFPAILIVVMGIVFLTQNTVFAEEIRIVRVMKDPRTGPGAGQLEYLVQPETLLIHKGTTVVFANSGVFQVGVIFEEGKTCQVGTKAAEGFKYDKATNCYQALIMPNGGTRSLRFLEKGVYEYRVAWGDRPQESKAKIIVY